MYVRRYAVEVLSEDVGLRNVYMLKASVAAMWLAGCALFFCLFFSLSLSLSHRPFFPIRSIHSVFIFSSTQHTGGCSGLKYNLPVQTLATSLPEFKSCVFLATFLFQPYCFFFFFEVGQDIYICLYSTFYYFFPHSSCFISLIFVLIWKKKTG